MPKPNILLITCDELRAGNLSCYGNRAIETTNIDWLAENGTRFTECHTVSPWCLPARCAILTGQYPHRSGAYSNFRRCALNNGIPNMFTLLKGGGYRINMFGKCHFAPVPYGETRPDRTLPYEEIRDYYMSLGLDHLDLEDGKQVSVWFYDDYAKYLEPTGLFEEYRRCCWDKSLGRLFPFPGPDEEQPDAWVGRKACEFIDGYDSDQPFFGWVSFSGPHYPIDPPKSYCDRVDPSKFEPLHKRDGELAGQDRIQHRSFYGRGNIDGCGHAPGNACGNYTEEYWDKFRVYYDANILLIDDWIGKILSSMRKKFGENTLILFTADHGDMAGHHGLWGKNNCAYDDVWKIPMILHRPGQTTGDVSDVMVNSLDILPTFLRSAELDAPKCVSGTDLDTQVATGGREYTFSEGEGFLAVTDGRYKFVRVRKNDEDFREFVDLEEDPYEYENRFSDPRYAPEIARLSGQLLDHVMKKVLP